mgnify:CR=1 FL=1
MHALSAHAHPLVHNAGIVSLPLGGKDVQKVVASQAARSSQKGGEGGFFFDEIKQPEELVVKVAKGVNRKRKESAARGDGEGVVLDVLGSDAALQSSAGLGGGAEVGRGGGVHAREVA